ncbi:MAG: NAD(P)/FAD-dependent oxidoreductase [Candidatus Methylomirabilales bacterium]
MTTSDKDRSRVVIVGCGFGGLWAARTLAAAPVDVVVIDRNNYHTFFPLLYQVAAAEIGADEIAYPVRGILRKIRNAQFAMAEVTRVDFEQQVVETDGPAFAYDFLILSMGSTSHFLGVPGASEHAFPLRTMDQAITLRNHILHCFELAVQERDPERRKRLLTLTIVGGGPTGVEFAGALSELIYRPLKRDYPTLDFQEVRVILLEAGESLLPTFPQQHREYAQTRLGKKGVKVHLPAVVTRVSPGAVYLKDGREIPSETVVWTAGVRGDPSAEVWGLPTARGGRIGVLPTLQVPNYPSVYVVGDLAYLEEGGHSMPMVAPVAIQQGEQAAKNIVRRLSGQPLEPFHYRDRGMMATIGRNAAVAYLLNRWPFTGFPAWVLWMGLHLFYLIGFRNRMFVMINWAWDYFLFERTVRLILYRHSPLPPSSPESKGSH